MSPASTTTTARASTTSWGRALLLLAPLLVLVSGAVWLLVRPQVQPVEPAPEEWLRAAETIRDRWQEGDVIRLEPGWMTAGRVYFGDLDGGAREPFRILDLHDPVDPAWLTHYRRLWLVTAVGAEESLDELVPVWAKWRETMPLDGLQVHLFELPRGALLWELRTALPDALVERRPSNQEKPVRCSWRHDRHRCGLKPRYDVGTELRRVDSSARQCVMVQPGPGPEPSVMTLSFPPLPGPGTLLLRVGNTTQAAVKAKYGQSVTITATVGDLQVGRLVLDRRDYQLHELRAELPDRLDAPLVISLEATDDKHREICFDGYVLTPGLDG